jgi:FG-GAP repeat
MRILVSVAALLCQLSLLQGAWGQCETAKFEKPPGAVAGKMGHAVSVSGDRAIVSSGNGTLVSGFADGQLFALQRDPQYPSIWSAPTAIPRTLLSEKLVGNLSEIGLGHSIDIDGDWAVVGGPTFSAAPGPEGLMGFLKYQNGAWHENIYIFGQEMDIALGFPLGNTIAFGYSVAISDRWAIVGAPDSNHAGPGSGSAFLFERSGDTWSLSMMLNPPTSWGPDGAAFGSSVDIFFDPASNRGILAVGGPMAYHSPSGTHPGKVYVLTWNPALTGSQAWAHDQSLSSNLFPPDFDPPFVADAFGTSVAVNDGFVIVGSPGWEPGTTFTDVGRGYVFQRTPTDELQIHEVIAQSQPTQNDGFGRSVSMDDGLAVVGSARINASAPGFATVFQKVGSTPTTTTWLRKESYAASDVSAPSTNHFGFNVAIDGQTIFAAAPEDPVSVEDGAAYAYTREKLPLCAAPQTVSRASGGSQTFTIDAGSAFAGMTYALAGSTSGYSPGFQWGSVVVPVNYNWLTAQGINHPNQPPYTNNLGTLDAQGKGTAVITIPPGVLDPTLVGTTIYHAYVVLNASMSPVFVSNPVPLRINP